jgi:ABC transport system ATP-binding/permease protein
MRARGLALTMLLRATIEGRTVTLTPGRPHMVGTAAGSDLPVKAPGFDGPILRIRHVDHWTVEVLGSPLSVAVDGQPTADRLVHVWPERGREVAVQGRDRWLTARFAVVPAGAAAGPAGAAAGPAGAPAGRAPGAGPNGEVRPIGVLTTFGRTGSGCDVQVNGMSVGRHHATLVRRSAGRYQLHDTGTGAGTFVGGRAIILARLPVGGSFTIGGSDFTIESDGVLVEQRHAHAATLAIRGLSARHPRGHPLGWLVRAVADAVQGRRGRGPAGIALRDLTIDLGARQVLAVLGPSGAGKTSLFKAIVGELEIVAGSVGFHGLDLVTHADQARHMLGYVPQQDHLHESLTARQVLDHAARLRLAVDTSRADRRVMIDDVAGALSIADRLDLRASELSGGERKRLSVGVEVIAQPSLLMLDEPTSGLDPGAALEVMRMLEGIAGQGCTVVLTTHSTDQLQGVDEVLVIGMGGRCAFVGRPDETLPAFRASSYANLMLQLRATPAPAGDPPPAPRPAAARRAPAQAPVHARRRARRARMLPTLAARELALLRSRGWLGMLTYLVVPVLGAVLAATRATNDGLGGRPLANSHALQALSLLVTTAVFAGQALTYGNLVGEYQVIRRERRTGVSPVVAVVAKLAVFGLVAAAQALVVAGIFFAWRRGATASLLGLDGRLEVSASLVLVTVAAMALGLLISACSHRLEWAVGLASAAAICQVALNGVLIELTQWSPLSVLSLALPARWGVAAGASTVDVLALTPGLPADALWRHTGPHLLIAWVVLCAQTAIFVALASWVLSRRIRADTR